MDYTEVAGWGDDPWARDVTGVAVDSNDRVYVLRRGVDPVTVLDRDGAVLGRWGGDNFSDRPHLISVVGDKAYVADDRGHRVLVFDLAGRLLETIGSGIPSSTGVDDKGQPTSSVTLDRMMGGPPFNRPTKAVPGPDGALFVSDGYGNCRVHRFSADRRVVHSWGGPGADEGCFVVPHSVAVDPEGRVLVCDRENDRIQVFSRDGALHAVWNDVQRPTDAAFDRNGFLYVTELARGPQDVKSWRLGPAERENPGQVTVFDADHAVVARITYSAAAFLAPHAIAVDSSGAIYVSEVPESFARSSGRPVVPHRCLRKFELTA